MPFTRLYYCDGSFCLFNWFFRVTESLLFNAKKLLTTRGRTSGAREPEIRTDLTGWYPPAACMSRLLQNFIFWGKSIGKSTQNGYNNPFTRPHPSLLGARKVLRLIKLKRATDAYTAYTQCFRRALFVWLLRLTFIGFHWSLAAEELGKLPHVWQNTVVGGKLLKLPLATVSCRPSATGAADYLNSLRWQTATQRTAFEVDEVVNYEIIRTLMAVMDYELQRLNRKKCTGSLT